ncbi:MAG: hypothetical protein M0Z50_03110 [Planctomycetia bacterium]|nr:hypothetical protein [Planctomycetia bacterium]
MNEKNKTSKNSIPNKNICYFILYFACFLIGGLVSTGPSLAQSTSPSHTMEWYRKAAAAGKRRAMVNIGVFYANGDGVPQDYTKAKYWFRKAERHGSPQTVKYAKKLLTKMAAEGH